MVFCVCIRWGSGAILFFFHAASIFAARGSADVWMDWLGVPQSHRAPPRTSGGGVDMSVCGCVSVSVRDVQGFERIVFCVFFVCFSVGKLSSGALVLCDNQCNSRFWPGVECWSCFSLRHRNGLSEIPDVHTFRAGFFCGSLAGVPRGILHRVCSCRSALRRQRGRDANHSLRHLLDHSTCVAHLGMFPVL